ncbi:MAG: hypothetical protein R2705_11070 [Ilumatobacteraceae bacterium]
MGWAHIVDLVATERYPLHDSLLAAYAELLHDASAAYRRDGWVEFPGFFHPDGVEVLRRGRATRTARPRA